MISLTTNSSTVLLLRKAKPLPDYVGGRSSYPKRYRNSRSMFNATSTGDRCLNVSTNGRAALVRVPVPVARSGGLFSAREGLAAPPDGAAGGECFRKYY